MFRGGSVTIKGTLTTLFAGIKKINGPVHLPEVHTSLGIAQAVFFQLIFETGVESRESVVPVHSPYHVIPILNNFNFILNKSVLLFQR
jgi:hypothetical protein